MSSLGKKEWIFIGRRNAEHLQDFSKAVGMEIDETIERWIKCASRRNQNSLY